MNPHINELDRQHLNAFPQDEKASLMQLTRTHEPNTRTRLGKDEFEEALLRLRQKGFELIDMQVQDSTFTSVWYRPGDGVPAGQQRPELTMVVWKGEGPDPFTAVLTWRL